MIPVSASTLDSNLIGKSEHSTLSWQQQMAQSFKSAGELLEFLNLKPADLPYSIDDSQPFSTRVTRHLASLINANNPYDPILLQVLPTQQENTDIEGFVADPLEEATANPIPGLIHKYKNRVLIIAHQACAMHCRYCFRRHFEYQQNNLNFENLEKIRCYLSEHPEINEVILSGGDPLSISDNKLAAIISTLNTIPHLRFLRIHSRTPVAIPDRLSNDFINLLTNQRLTTTMVVHINHPNELPEQLKRRLLSLKAAGINLLNQSVLLKTINDSADILIELNKKLFEAGVMPYYLHMPDKVQGTSHFYIDHTQAAEIWDKMQRELSGYLVPKLVREIPGKVSKTWVNPTHESEY